MTVPDRPLWFLPAGNHVAVRSDSKRQPGEVTHWCREGDPGWTPVGGALAEPEGRFVGWNELLGDLTD